MVDTAKCSKLSKTSLEISKLDTALVAAAKTVHRYKGSPYESAAVEIFERVEAAHSDQRLREQTIQRALTLLEHIA